MTENLPPVEHTEVNGLMQPIAIETDRPGLLLVQMLTPEDDQEYFDFQNRNRDHIAEFNNTIYENVEAVTSSRLDKNKVRFGIRLNDVLIGIEGYTSNDEGTQAEIGIMLAKDATGHGYALSALKAMTDYVAPKFERIYAEADPTNQRSIRLCERAGYVKTGEAVHEWGPSVVMDFAK